MAKVYGNPSTDGAAILTATATSVDYGTFTFQFHAPADVAEVKRLLEDPAAAMRVMGYVVDALKTDARGKAWADARKANQVTVTVSGREEKASKAMAAELARLRAELAKHSPKGK